MRQRVGLLAVFAFLAVIFSFGVQRAIADDEDPPPAEKKPDDKPDDDKKPDDKKADDHKGDDHKDDKKADDHKDDKKADDHKDDKKADDHKGDDHKDDKKADDHKDEASAGGAAETPDEPPAATADDPAGTGSKKGDEDGDGVPDAEEDEDGDGIPDSQEDEDGDGVPDGKEDADGDGIPDNKEDEDGDGTPDMEEAAVCKGKAANCDVDGDGIPDEEQEFDEDDPPTDPFDADGDGVVEPEEKETQKEFVALFKHIPDHPDGQALDRRTHGKDGKIDEGKLKSALKASITADNFRKLVHVAKKVVLAKMQTKNAKKQAKKMKTLSYIVIGVSASGLLLLLMPLFLRKKYPGQGKVLFKYSAIAAGVFVVTVNLFGLVLYGFRTVQGAAAEYTNPATALASGTFDTLDKNADDYLTTGKELFAPTLDEMRKHPDKQPSELLLENAERVVKDAKVFLTIKKMIKSIDFLLAMIPTILILVTLILFILAILPTLKEIIKLPAAAAQGNMGAGKEVMAKAAKRVKGEILATLCVIGVLVLVTFVSAFVLGRMVMPAMDAFLRYLAISVNYLLFAGGTSGMVFIALFAVILFLVLNLAVLILSMVFFLGKTQKVFQARFCDDIPLSTHSRWFKWASPSILLVQLFPMIFAFAVSPILKLLRDKFIGAELNPASVNWTAVLILGPVVLVVLFLILFWVVRGLKAIKFLATYKIPKVTDPQGVPVTPPSAPPPQQY